MFEIRHISTLSLGRVGMLLSGAVYLLFGVCVAILYGAVRTIALGELLQNNFQPATLLLIWFAGLIVVLPISFLCGVFTAACYNLFARWWGGLQVQLTKTEHAEMKREVDTKGMQHPLKKKTHHGETR